MSSSSIQDRSLNPVKDIDLKHLVDGRSFQILPSLTSSDLNGYTTTELEELDAESIYDRHLYLAAALKCHQTVVDLDNTNDYLKVFRLWQLRISSLMLARLNSAAIEEVRNLGDLGADRYRLEDGTCIVPWQFRIMVVNLQSGGNTQPGISRYYTLAREARVELGKAETRSGSGLDNVDEPFRYVYVGVSEWSNRLKNLGLYVASTLMAMGDSRACIHHLKSLAHHPDSDFQDEFSYRVSTALGLAYLQIGDTLSAREWFRKLSSSVDTEFLNSVCWIADADWDTASTELEVLLQKSKECEDKLSEDKLSEAKNNFAISRLHQGNLAEAMSLLESLGDNKKLRPTILFNLFTLYELRYDQASQRKQRFIDHSRKKA